MPHVNGISYHPKSGTGQRRNAPKKCQLLSGIGGWSRATTSGLKKVQAEASEVMSPVQEENVWVAIPTLPAMPTDVVEFCDGTSKERGNTFSFAESSLSERSVPSEVSIESSKDIFFISLPSIASKSNQDDETDMVQNKTSFSLFVQKIVGGKIVK